MRGGYYEEAMEWRNWLLRASAGDPSQIQIMYGAGGERRLDEWEVDWLPGYERSAPVRIGNAAAGQFQLDVYGEVMSALYESCHPANTADESAWSFQTSLMEFLETGWREPDDGIWEVRGPRRHFTHSKVMAWVAMDRAIRSIEEYHLEGPLDRWRQIRERDPRPGLRRGVQRQQGLVHPVLRLRQPRRQPAHDPAHGLPAGPRPTGPWHHRGHRARARPRRVRAAVQHGRDGARRRPCRAGGRIPGLLVLAGRLPVDAGPAP